MPSPLDTAPNGWVMEVGWWWRDTFIILDDLLLSEKYTFKLSSSCKFLEEGNVLVFPSVTLTCKLWPIHGSQREVAGWLNEQNPGLFLGIGGEIGWAPLCSLTCESERGTPMICLSGSLPHWRDTAEPPCGMRRTGSGMDAVRPGCWGGRQESSSGLRCQATPEFVVQGKLKFDINVLFSHISVAFEEIPNVLWRKERPLF